MIGTIDQARPRRRMKRARSHLPVAFSVTRTGRRAWSVHASLRGRSVLLRTFPYPEDAEAHRARLALLAERALARLPLFGENPLRADELEEILGVTKTARSWARAGRLEGRDLRRALLLYGEAAGRAAVAARYGPRRSRDPKTRALVAKATRLRDRLKKAGLALEKRFEVRLVRPARPGLSAIGQRFSRIEGPWRNPLRAHEIKGILDFAMAAIQDARGMKSGDTQRALMLYADAFARADVARSFGPKSPRDPATVKEVDRARRLRKRLKGAALAMYRRTETRLVPRPARPAPSYLGERFRRLEMPFARTLPEGQYPNPLLAIVGNPARKFEDYLAQRRAARPAEKQLDTSDLDRRFVPFFESGERIKVRDPALGVVTGTVGISTGWRPVFLLIRTRRSLGGQPLGPSTEILEILARPPRPLFERENPRARSSGTAQLAKTAPGYAEAERAFRRFHGEPPTGVTVYRYQDGQRGVTRRVLVALGTVPETHYRVPWGSNKKGYHWVHKHPSASPPLEVLDPRTGITSKIGGTYKVTDWWHR